MDAPAAYIAHRADVLYSLAHASEADLRAVCRARGYPVERASCRGFTVLWPRLAIYLGSCEPDVLAHELFHCWVSENVAWGIDYPPDIDGEAEAEAFARLVCG